MQRLHEQEALKRKMHKCIKIAEAKDALEVGRKANHSTDLEQLATHKARMGASLYASPLRGGGGLPLIANGRLMQSTSKGEKWDKPSPFVDGEEQKRHKNKIK
jgi:hypothetical protein